MACCLVNVCFRLSLEVPSDSVAELVFLSLVGVSGGGVVVVVMLGNLLVLSTVPLWVGGGGGGCELC